MAYLPYAVEQDAVYTLTGPAAGGSVVAVFNNPASGNYVGMLTEITGLDSPEVRESAEDLVEADGGSHGSFYFSRRPIVLNCSVFGHSTIAARSARIDKARRASTALRTDATLSWVTSAGTSMFVPVRRQQPFRETGAWNKTLQIALVSEYAVLFGSTLKTGNMVTVNTPISVENQGSYPSYGTLTITGPPSGTFTNAQFVNVTDSNRTFKTTGLTLAANEVVVFDLLNHTGVFTAGSGAHAPGTSANRYIDFATTAWPAMLSGTNSIKLTGTGVATASLAFRDTWA